MSSLKAAIYSRWNAAGLNSSIAPLFPGQESETDSEAVPPDTDLPRAEYFVDDTLPNEISRCGRVQMTAVTFRIYMGGPNSGIDVDTTVGNAVQAIVTAFVNSEQAATSPLAFASSSSGAIMDVGFGATHTAMLRRNVGRGLAEILVRHVVPNAIPS